MTTSLSSCKYIFQVQTTLEHQCLKSVDESVRVLVKRIQEAIATTPSETTSVSQDATTGAAADTSAIEAPDVTEASLINLPPTPPPPPPAGSADTPNTASHDAFTDTSTASEAETMEASAATEDVVKTDTGECVGTTFKDDGLGCFLLYA